MEAILHGADAVYIGGPAFGARAAAGNSLTDIAALCAFAHTYYAKVYVALNTIIYASEIPQVQRLVHDLWKAGADALIIQDTALLEMELPPIELHASTQMDNRTAQDLMQRAREGFTRTVVARELSLEEMSRLHRQVPVMEMEAFVHGALCVSYSGKCYASAHKFGRSANRGCCAQFCRLAFDLVNGKGKLLEKHRHLLSLKDMNRMDDLESMMDAGVVSFKIEGRLKDTNYVKNVTAAYRQAIDRILDRRPQDYCRASAGTSSFTFTPQVQKSFNRGFTDYFLHGRDEGIHSFDTPKSMGERVGKMSEMDQGGWIRIAYDAHVTPLSPGDGLCYLNSRHQLEGMSVNKVEGDRFQSATLLQGLPKGTWIHRNHDQIFSKALQRPTAQRKLPIRLSLKEIPDGYRLTATENVEHGMSAACEMKCKHQHAQTPQRDNMLKNLAKWGNTPFSPDEIELQVADDAFIPASLLAELRREVSAQLLADKAAAWNKRRSGISAPCPPVPHPCPLPANLQLDHTANVANPLARKHYERMGCSVMAQAYELEPPAGAVVMTTRHCIRRALGHCLKEQQKAGGQANDWNSPLFLRTTDGELFPLRFDCQRCEMQVMTGNPSTKPVKP